MFVADATQEPDVAALVALALSRFGGLEVFFAKAGTPGGVVPFFDQTPDTWESMYRDNVISAFLASKHAGRHMAAQGRGSIILNSSTGSLRAKGIGPGDVVAIMLPN